MYYFSNQEKNIKNVNLDRERCKNVNLETLLRKDSPNSLFHKEPLTAFHTGLTAFTEFNLFDIFQIQLSATITWIAK